MMFLDHKIRLKVTAALTGAAMGLAGAAFAAGIFVTPAKLFASGAAVEPPTDTTAPMVTSIVRAGASPTNASSVQFTVTFSEDVTGVDGTDFVVTPGGLVTGASLSSVSADSGSTRTVTVSTGTGSGTIRLDVTDDDSIVDTAGNQLGGPGISNGDFNTGDVFTIDKAAPTVSSITAPGANPTNAASVDFTVTFSEAVTNVGTTDFTLNLSGVTGAGVTSVSADSGSTRTVTVSTGTGSGTIRLDLTDDDSIVDAATNPLGGAGAGNGNFTGGQTYTIDKTAPTVSSIARAGSSPTNAVSVDFTVTFSEAVTDVDTTDFALNASGVTGASVSNVSGGPGSARTVTVSTGTGSGTIGLDLTDDDSILDAATNPLGGTGVGNGNFTGESYSIDKTPPTATITFPVSGGVYNTAGFNAGCSTPGGDFCGTAADDVSMSGVAVSVRQGTGNYWNGTAFASSTEVLLAAVGLPSWTFSFTGSNFAADGSYTLRAEPTDMAGNKGTVSTTFTIDNTPPAGTDVQTANKPGGVAGKAEQVDTITFAFSELVIPSSFVSGWDGSTRNVVVRFMNGTGQSNDSLQVYDATNTTLLPLGTVDLGGKDYSTEKGQTILTFGATGTASTMVISGTQIVVTLGTASSANVGTATNGTMIWTPAAGPTDRAGNPMSTAAVTETGAADGEF